MIIGPDTFKESILIPDFRSGIHMNLPKEDSLDHTN